MLYLENTIDMIKNNDYSGLEKIKERNGAGILDLYSELVKKKKQIKRTKEKETGSRNSIPLFETY